MPQSHRLLVLLYGVTALTGQACTLVWMKRLTLVLGMTLPAVGAVLAVALTGYGLGAWVVGRYCRDGWNVSRIFAGLQLGLGAWILALPSLFSGLEWAYVAIAPPLETAGHQAIRLALVVPVLLPPAAAMGAIFPIVSAAGVSRVFAVGVTGSLAGVLAGALLFLPGLGIDASLYRLGATNLALAAVAAFLPRIPASPVPGGDEPCGRACALAAILGVALFLAETVWLQLVWFVVDQTAYAEGLVVGAVFLAMAAGAWGAVRPRPRLPALLVATALAQLLLIPGMGWLAGAWNRLAGETSFTGFLALEFLLALGVVGLPSIGYGYAVPRVCEGFRPRAVGRIWAAHYAGGMVAALAAPFLVIPALGVTVTLALASACLAVPFLLDRRWLPALALLVPCAVAPVVGDATFRDAALGADKRVLFQHADGSGIVEVYEHAADKSRTLHSSRRMQEGGDNPDQVEFERLQGRLPVSLHHPHRRVLVIGLGTGVTVGGMLLEPGIEQLTCVEISEGVLRAARLFGHANGRLFEDPRVRLVRQDGRNFIRLSREQYDLIVQELFFPYREGVGSLYTVEHFRRCRDRLAPGGRVAQCISTFQIGPEELRSIVRTFQSVFPRTSLWLMRGGLMMLGGDQPLVPSADAPLRHFIAADDAVAAWTADAPLNTEDNSLIEFRVPRLYRWLNTLELAAENLRQLSEIQQDATALAPGLPVGPSTAARHLYAGILAQQQGDVETALRELKRALELDPGNVEARNRLEIQEAQHPRGGTTR